MARTIRTLALCGVLAIAPAVRAQRRPATLPTPSAVATAAPNIIVLVVEGLGWQDLSVPLYRDTTDANRRHLTPAMARLAATGVTFTDAYAAAPIGTPTRVALLTGQSPALTRVTGASITRDIDSSPPFPLLRAPDWNVNGLSTISKTPHAYSAPALPSLLRGAGYRTVQIGAAGWSAAGVAASDAMAIGFDESDAGVRTADSLAATATRAMDAARAMKKPFFLWLGFDTSNTPEDVDASLATVLAYLERASIADKTVVVLLSDHGAPAIRDEDGPRHFQNSPLRSGMGSPYEGGVRTPLLVRWPGVARAGLRSATPVSSVDLFATLIRAGKVPNASALARTIAGRDLTSTLDNSTPLPLDRPLLWHAPHISRANSPDVEPFTALRVGQWKLIFYYAGSRYELYDLSHDIGESRELSLRQPEIAAALSETMRRLLTETKAQMPIDAAYGTPMLLPGRFLTPTPP